MTSAATDFAREREAMVALLRRRGIIDRDVLAAFAKVPREAFVDTAHAGQAYGDHPLPIDAGQTISQPYIVALMVEAAGVKPGDRVLEIGAGSGYAAAIIAQVAAHVVGIERHPVLAESARDRLHRLGIGNVTIVAGDGTLGRPEDAPFDAILAAASGSHVPQPLIDQLADGGTLVMPIGDARWSQHLIRVTKRPGGGIRRDHLGEVRFVPLIGQEGWGEGV